MRALFGSRMMRLMWMMMLLAGLADGHNNAVCLTTSPSYPGVMTIWMTTYHPAPAPGKVVPGRGFFQTQPGINFDYPFGEFCSPRGSWKNRMGFKEPTTEQMLPTLNNNAKCTAMRIKGAPLIAADSFMTCFSEAQIPTNECESEEFKCMDCGFLHPNPVMRKHLAASSKLRANVAPIAGNFDGTMTSSEMGKCGGGNLNTWYV